MKSIYILGSGGFAKEVYALIKDIGEYKLEGFIDRESSEGIQFREKTIPVLSENEFLAVKQPKDCALAIGVGDPALIKKITGKFDAFHFPNLIHPNVVYDMEEIHFGRGNIVTAGVIFTTCIEVGDFNVFNLSTTVGHDCKIGSCNVINPAVNISGGVSVGDGNLLGVASTILQYKTIGNNAVVGASSLVTKNVENNTVVIGVPAKQLIKE